jgi:hypothetical protein
MVAIEADDSDAEYIRQQAVELEKIKQQHAARQRRAMQEAESMRAMQETIAAARAAGVPEAEIEALKKQKGGNLANLAKLI